MGTVNSDWPPERVQKLQDLFSAGLSFSQIASELAMTRNAVLGKCNRLGLKRDLPPRKPFVHQIKRRDPRVKDPGRKQRSRAEKIVDGPTYAFSGILSTPEADLAIPAEQRRTIATIGRQDCKFGVGDPRTKEFFFCGAPRLPSLPYCASHARRCFLPAKGCS
jgi:GcrA cell cycle regulator